MKIKVGNFYKTPAIINNFYCNAIIRICELHETSTKPGCHYTYVGLDNSRKYFKYIDEVQNLPDLGNNEEIIKLLFMEK